MVHGLEIGKQAPATHFTDNKGDVLDITSFKGKKNVVVFFYPKSFTNGCTRENVGFAQNYDKFSAMNTEIIGVSKDDTETQDKFVSCYKLPFPVCSDTDGAAAKDFELGTDFFGLVNARVTFIINKEGIVVEKYHGMWIMSAHIEAALKAVEKLEGK
eukprot:TRINITY_DN4155_c0_g1_i1.p1 TRINITY_DN4155_c0_g1~~TRINITY_DN4155_c0_g1_i1.p1  ORF type:complete len:157 (-),score=39.76 TRINITY_DN4155_c0_g1_i1:82-552(-)